MNRTPIHLLTLAAVLTLPATAGAQAPALPIDELMVSRSSVIVFGEIRSAGLTSSEHSFTDSLLEVEDVLKGGVAGSQIVVRHPGGPGEGYAGERPLLAEGNRVLLFLGDEESGAYSIVEYPLGIFWEARMGHRSLLLGWGAAAGPGVPAATEPGSWQRPRDGARFRQWIADRVAGVEPPAAHFTTSTSGTEAPVGSPEATTSLCTPTSDAFQLDGGYRVRLCYRTPQNDVGQGRSGIWASGQAGLFWFFSRDNPEALIKVVDGCAFNQHRWVFFAPVTDLGLHLQVLGRTKTWTYTNPVGRTAPAAADTAAFFCAQEDGGRPPDGGDPPDDGTDDPKPGETFRDNLRSGGSGPELVVIPAGTFQMGCFSGVTCHDNEKPVHSVTIPNVLAVGKYEVTFAEWDACVAAGSCNHRPSDRWGRGSHPVMGVSWNDTKDYMRWLSQETGEIYRLLSESEWEYAARAGSRTAYFWGNEIDRGRANYGSSRTVPVGSFGPNGFGLHDMHGNVWEWAEDCWNDSYKGAPSDGSAWLSADDCSLRVFRGGSWADRPVYVRSAKRGWSPADHRDFNIGFRVARMFARGSGKTGPDLVVEPPSVDKTEVRPNEVFTIRVNVVNRGNATSDATTLRYYQSRDRTIDRSEDLDVGTDRVDSLAAGRGSTEGGPLRAPSTAGTYYFGACVDSVAGDSDRSNDCSSGVRVTVSMTGGDPGFNLASENASPRGITYAGGRFFVVDSSDEEVYAYRSDGRRYASLDFDLRSVNTDPQGIAYNRSVFYVVDVGDEKVYAYRDGRRYAGGEFDLHPANASASGIVCAAGRFYVADLSDGKVYAYRGSDGRRETGAEFNLAGANGYPSGIAYSGSRFYVVDRDDDKVYAYRASDGRRDSGAEFKLDGANGDPDGVVYYDGKLFVVDSRDDKVYVYSLGG